MPNAPDKPDAGSGYRVRVVNRETILPGAKETGMKALVIPLVPGFMIIPENRDGVVIEELRMSIKNGHEIVRVVLDNWELLDPLLRLLNGQYEEKRGLLLNLLCGSDGMVDAQFGTSPTRVVRFNLLPGFYSLAQGELISLVFPLSEAFYMVCSIARQLNCNVSGIADCRKLLLAYPSAGAVKKQWDSDVMGEIA